MPLPKQWPHETAGKDRADAIARTFADYDRLPGSARKKAADRFIVVRVRRLGPNWWVVLLRAKRAARRKPGLPLVPPLPPGGPESL